MTASSRFSAAWLARQPELERRRAIESLSPTDRARLAACWEFWARDEQLPPPGDWVIWLILSGRGWGKTRTGAEWVRRRVRDGARRIIVAGPTANDLRAAMIEGEAGILAVSPAEERPKYEPSKLRLTWPGGARAELISADEPERFRNKTADTIWVDELAAWPDRDAWDQLQFTFRLAPSSGLRLRAIVTTTPKPKPLVRELVARAEDGSVALTRGTTYDNRANLAPEFFARVVSPYEGTRLGRQELYAELLDDAEGALWSRALVDRTRVAQPPSELRAVAVAVDPSGGDGQGHDEVGIVAAGVGADGHGYVLEDASGRYTPDGWARRAIECHDRWGADRIVAEVNYGGDMVAQTISTAARDAGRFVFVRKVSASRGKQARAEPVAALYEQGRVHHAGAFPALEDEMAMWEPRSARSPNRMDALVWALSDLMVTRDPGAVALPGRSVATQFNSAGLPGSPRRFQW